MGRPKLIMNGDQDIEYQIRLLKADGAQVSSWTRVKDPRSLFTVRLHSFEMNVGLRKGLKQLPEIYSNLTNAIHVDRFVDRLLRAHSDIELRAYMPAL